MPLQCASRVWSAPTASADVIPQSATKHSRFRFRCYAPGTAGRQSRPLPPRTGSPAPQRELAWGSPCGQGWPPLTRPGDGDGSGAVSRAAGEGGQRGRCARAHALAAPGSGDIQFFSCTGAPAPAAAARGPSRAPPSEIRSGEPRRRPRSPRWLGGRCAPRRPCPRPRRGSGPSWRRLSMRGCCPDLGKKGFRRLNMRCVTAG